MVVPEVDSGDRRPRVGCDTPHDEDPVGKENPELGGDPRDREDEHDGRDPEPHGVEREASGDVPSTRRPAATVSPSASPTPSAGIASRAARSRSVLVDDPWPGHHGAERDRRACKRPGGGLERVERHEDGEDRDRRDREVQLDEDARKPAQMPFPETWYRSSVASAVSGGSRQ